MSLTSKPMTVATAVALALFFGAAPLAACSSGAPAPDETAEAPAEETEVEEEAEPEADEAMWVKVSEKYTETPSGESEGAEEYVFTTVYERDEAGNILTETNSDLEYGDLVFTYEVDENGWPVTQTMTGDDVETEVSTYENQFDANGLLTMFKSGESTQEYTYYPSGRVKSISTTNEAYQVDAEGNRVEGSEHTVHNSIAYDEDGFVTARSSELGEKSESEYAYERDGEGRPISYEVTRYHFDDSGNRDEGSLWSTAKIEYDNNGNVSRIVVERETGTVVQEYEYALIEHPSAYVKATEGAKNN